MVLTIFHGIYLFDIINKQQMVISRRDEISMGQNSNTIYLTLLNPQYLYVHFHYADMLVLVTRMRITNEYDCLE